MTMPVNIEEKIAKLSPERRRKVEARAQELIADELSLRDLRKAMGKTQVAMARKLGLKQENVSRVEKRTDMLLSTLNGYLRALGGRLRLVAEFKGRGAINIAGLAAIEPSKPAVRAAPLRATAKRARKPPRPRKRRAAKS
jgi:DNA-binding XRE family transcriptional regulator